MPPVPGVNIVSMEVKLYEPEMVMGEPTVLPPDGGQLVVLVKQVLNGLQLTLPAFEVKVTLSDEAGMPIAYPEMLVASVPMVVAQPLPAQSTPRVEADRQATFTAWARL